MLSKIAAAYPTLGLLRSRSGHPQVLQGHNLAFTIKTLTCTNLGICMLMQAELQGVLPVQQGMFQGMQQTALRWPNRLKQAAAVCNGLTMVGKHTVVGLDMERTMFKAVEARFLV